MGFASFVWSGNAFSDEKDLGNLTNSVRTTGFFYLAGGEKTLEGPYYRDFWRLNLDTLDAWEALPPYPIPECVTGHVMGWSMVVYKEKAYLFTGSSRLDFFDLKAKTWGTMATTLLKRGSNSRAGFDA